ncbi:leukotriene A-4 hydrolase-like isoform X1 [Pecten maximus]|uniref:leukotriene A-4 hydrolase-like isoform X1 n=2 Tax=Pecten maximus TaxID=6579 RepID=UPI001458B4B1|nr:leukotriene A-4 hydrolase-like isoform X1 [Pecten maximus]
MASEKEEKIMQAAGLSPTDPCSYSRPDECIVTKIDLDLDIDFDNTSLRGEVHLSLQKKRQGIDHVVLDTREVTIKKVTDQANGQELTFTLGEHDPNFGSKLDIRLPNGGGSSCVVSVVYETSPQCSALQWLRKEQTAGKRQPYLFSQCQAIHCRSMIPCQDTPAVKCAYSANITARREVTVLMSALRLGSEPHPTDSSKLIHKFEQTVPIASYLIAIVSGDIESRDIGPRSKVWSEAEMVDKAAYEFDETEHMLQTAEALMGPYVWGQYDLLVLPPSFPYGGMENPCLTFVTPTLLAGDRSLANVVAHEIAHSWTGNLVTNSNFEHFWLNEGHTVFVERKIAGRLHGGEAMRHFTGIGGWKSLQYGVVEVLKNGPYTKLIPDLCGVDPDDAFSVVPYEKGFALLFYLETLVGGPDVFEPFLRAYIERFQGDSIVTEQWKEFLFSYFRDKVDAGVFDEVEWDKWFFGQGMPPVKPKYDDSVAVPCADLCQRWVKAAEEDFSTFKAEDLEALSTVQRREFLSLLLLEEPFSPKKIQAMEGMYNLNSVKNSEIRFSWLRMCIRAQCEDCIPRALDFVNEQGRMKFVRPIYRDLYNWEKSRQLAINNLQANRDQMHNTTAKLVATKDLHLPN